MFGLVLIIIGALAMLLWAAYCFGEDRGYEQGSRSGYKRGLQGCRDQVGELDDNEE